MKPLSKKNLDILEFIKNDAKPFVKWVGGKRQLINQFNKIGFFPKNFNQEKSTYFEPFIGGGAVFFDFTPKNSVISDLNQELIITYIQVRDNIKELIESLKKHKYEKEYFLSIRALETQKLSEVEIASRFIFLNRTCFNGLYRVNKSGKFNVPFGKYKNPKICDEENLQNCSLALKNVEIKYQDYKKIESQVKKGDFIYFDPPYQPISKTSSFTSYTSSNFNEQNQIELRDFFKKLSDEIGCFVALSNSDCEFIRDIYQDFKIHEISANRAINSNSQKRGKIGELLITNY